MHNLVTPFAHKFDIPPEIAATPLWTRIAERPEYALTVVEIRRVASALGAKIATSMPEYTDHSVKHMDSLWRVAGQILLPAEMEKFSVSEAFVLGAAFYLHDLGMAGTITAAGQDEIKSTEQYKVAFARFRRSNLGNEARAENLALREATRELHAAKAIDLAASPIPGLSRFLIEDSDLRGRWAFIIGRIAASHHWSMEEVERSLGASKLTPGPDGENLDLGYLASVLRVIDFAHIDRARAPRLERLLRSEISKESGLHWDAQENITGPMREGDFLVFACTQPIANVEAWWLFYDLSSALDAEIRGVHEYLRNRTVSVNRFSLKGVKATESPAAFSEYVRLAEGVLPIDIRVQPDSMERIVELLGGRHIYGPDELAPVRELIQNARDAIELRRALERAEGRAAPPGEITVSLREHGAEKVLAVRDNGVGMTGTVVRKHLLGVGSDFWNSLEFYSGFRKAIDAGFRPIGKFGIGFLSVFMLGDRVVVETESVGNSRLRLTLDGIGKRGELREIKETGQVGSEIQITLKGRVPELLENLPHVVRARAPMMTIPIVVNLQKGGTTASERIDPGWWRRVSEETLVSFVGNWSSYAHKGKAFTPDPRNRRIRYHEFDAYVGSQADLGGKWTVKGWPGTKPQFVDESQRLLSQGGETSYGVICCSQGIAIETIRIPDITGLAEIGEVELTVARESITEPDDSHRSMPSPAVADIRDKIFVALRPTVIARLDELHAHGMLPGRTKFLRGLVTIFGEELLSETSLQWIPVTLPPGNLIHHSRQELIDRVRVQNRVLLSVGANPGGTYAIASSSIPTADLGRMMVLSLNIEEIEVSYSAKNKLDQEALGGVIRGTLDRILSVLSEVSRSTTEPLSEVELNSRLLLANFLMECIGQSWGMSVTALRGQSWYFHYQDNVLYGDLRRI